MRWRRKESPVPAEWSAVTPSHAVDNPLPLIKQGCGRALPNNDGGFEVGPAAQVESKKNRCIGAPYMNRSDTKPGVRLGGI